ncbi:FMN-dependent NADH-azoreductase [Peribacillus simplex]|uniref:FMN dependent NADH:quinone oxidoreductase n=1 Tax=Peribacillus simplex TaxID=1478 RepID=A0AAW7IQG5_9BACI|nr:MULTISPECIES: FMN-dependent NADH-azoreductase [Peribacillus]SNT38907.1 FMN-dependent NADH-azoreductase [Bacillus sp. OK838]AMM94342.1 FMN-dependent NADH-azoreductase [Peribacillus simplex]MDM5293378.1 FMN-dependent NADH-azoreductase [Peribacillus simplex]MDM5452322.1 FMN-dependent NADH-azoreductase [Peribacillus simplex]MDV7767030.1 FMN-dependent NADH-azoreductase [Peribacillus sp. CSMR9]
MGFLSRLFGNKETAAGENGQMTKVLFVKVNDRPADQAISSKMYDTFLETYKETHRTDEVTELDLFKEELPYYGNTAITGLYKRNQGLELTAEEEKAANLVDQYLNQFLAMDKVVFAFPLWNATVPAPLITYLSYLAQAGKMFNYTAEGPVGYAGDKKVMLLNARGSDYALEGMASAEMAVNLVKNIISLWGINNPEAVVIEGHNQYPDRTQKIIADGLENVAKAAETF